MPLPLPNRSDIDRALNSYTASAQALQDFQTACQNGDEAIAEAARARVLGGIESFMDNYAAAYMRSHT